MEWIKDRMYSLGMTLRESHSLWASVSSSAKYESRCVPGLRFSVSKSTSNFLTPSWKGLAGKPEEGREG